jgi:hypothetical protein
VQTDILASERKSICGEVGQIDSREGELMCSEYANTPASAAEIENTLRWMTDKRRTSLGY